jgi:hypothetical protein
MGTNGSSLLEARGADVLAEHERLAGRCGRHQDTKSTDSAVRCAIVSGGFRNARTAELGFGNPSGAHDVRSTDGVLIILGGALVRWLTR